MKYLSSKDCPIWINLILCGVAGFGYHTFTTVDWHMFFIWIFTNNLYYMNQKMDTK